MFMKNNNVIVAAIQETWLSSDVNITIKDYSIMKVDKLDSK